MASRAHIIHDYSFGSAHSRPRQVLYRREDPVELPRNSVWRAGGGALLAAVAVSALVVGGVYAAFREPPPQMAETPALAPLESWQPDPSIGAARMTNLLAGPALSVPDRARPFVETETEEDVPSSSSDSAAESRAYESRAYEPPASESREVIIDDSKMYPPASTPAPYPNPTTTPPDAIATPETNQSVPAPAPVAPAPSPASENPYRE